jgi:hypothetical protein
MTLITYQHRALAMAAVDRFHLAPHVDQRPHDDPLKRFVYFLALYARDVQLGHLPGEPRRSSHVAPSATHAQRSFHGRSSKR